MIPIRTTTALIATISAITVASMLGAATLPQAFAQVNIFQAQSNSASNTATVSGSFNSVDQDIEQGACLNAAGADRGSFASAFQSAGAFGGDFSDNEATIDCS